MKFLSILYFVIIVGFCACQRSSGIGDDSDTIDTASETEFQSDAHSDALDTGEDSSTIDTNASTDQGNETDTVSESENGTESETFGEDTGSDTTPLPEPIENEWVDIEGGTFEMGSNLYQATSPRHSVTVPTFEMLKTEVTVYQYRQCVDAGACTEPIASEEQFNECRPDSKYRNWEIPERLNYPVNCISYFQAGEYCAWLGGRLSSEAEWEYAARDGGNDIDYPWGEMPPLCKLVVATGGPDYDSQKCSDVYGLPVCSKTLGNTTQGLCDMAGNYEEWVADRVNIQEGYESAPVDGTALIYDDYQTAVTRGGNYNQWWNNFTVYLRSYEYVNGNGAFRVTIRCVR